MKCNDRVLKEEEIHTPNRTNDAHELSEENYRGILALLSKKWDNSGDITLIHDGNGTWVKMSIKL